jgi:hypothetical protein
LPDVLTAADLVSGYEAGSWFGIGAPKAPASSVIRQLKTPLLSRLGFPIGACHEHPGHAQRSLARIALFLALLGNLACLAKRHRSPALRMRGRLAAGPLTINRDRNATSQFIPANVISCVARPRNKERKNYLSN